MSGIEVAGVVLGAFPLAIWALERYQGVAKQMGFWYEIRSEYQRNSNALKFHRLLFERNLEQLLLPLVGNDDRLQDMISKPGGPVWKDAEIQKALETRLQKSYALYIAILGDMDRAMKELNQELAVEDTYVQSRSEGRYDQEPGQNPQTSCAPESGSKRAGKLRQAFDRSNLEYQVFRVKFSLGEGKRKALFRELQTYNDQLEKLTITSDAIAELQSSCQKAHDTCSAVNTALLKCWDYAEKLYRIMMDAWNCTHDQHYVQLILQHRTTVSNEFRLGLSSVGIKIPGSSLIATCPVKIRLLEYPTPQPTLSKNSKQSKPSNVSPHTVNLSYTTEAPAKRPFSSAFDTNQGHYWVDNSLFQQGSLSTTTTVTLPQREKATTRVVPNTVELARPIQSLCATLAREVPPSSHCIGYMQDEDVRYFIYSDGSSVPKSSELQLLQILRGEVKPPLTRRQRYRLALTLASSFVQLKDSPWMQASWGKEDVYFARSESDNVLFLDSPYMVHNFNTCMPAEPAADHKARQDVVSGIICIGIMLLELCFGSAIEHHPRRAEFPPGDEQTKSAFDLIAAMQWMTEVNEEAGESYTEAVEWCLLGCRTSIIDGSWRGLMTEKVIVPLENAVNTWKK
ncbi:hypothetical protein PG984_014861 [Apiospora sp. TS-2023a]